MIRALTYFGLMTLLAACQTTPHLPVTAANGQTPPSQASTLQAPLLQAQVVPSATLPKYLTLDQNTTITTNWIPSSPVVLVDGMPMPIQSVGTASVTFKIPITGGWGGPHTLVLLDGSNQFSRTSYVLGRSYLYANTPKQVMFWVGPGKTQADLQNFLDNKKLDVAIHSFSSLGNSCGGSLAVGSYSGSGSFERALEQMDAAAATDPSLILGVNPLTTGVTGADTITTEPIDPDSQAMQGKAEINVAAAHSSGWSGKGSLIAVLDTGVANAAYDLDDRLLSGMQFTSQVQESARTDDDFRVNGAVIGHGTQVAALAAGQTFGAAPGAQILPVKVCDQDGKCRSSDVIRGLCWAMDSAKSKNLLGHLVVNMSLGGDTGDFERDILRGVMLRAANSYNVAFVASAGNDWNDYLDGAAPLYPPRNYPAALSVKGLITVGAVYQLKGSPEKLKTSRYSNRGLWVDLLAPGTQLFAPQASGQVTASNTGTSFAAPLAAGAVALWWQKNPEMRSSDIEINLRNTANSTRVLLPNQDERDSIRLTRLLDLGVLGR